MLERMFSDQGPHGRADEALVLTASTCQWTKAAIAGYLKFLFCKLLLLIAAVLKNAA